MTDEKWVEINEGVQEAMVAIDSITERLRSLVKGTEIELPAELILGKLEALATIDSRSLKQTPGLYSILEAMGAPKAEWLEEFCV